MYDYQDFCVFWGYDEETEIGKIEYSLLEAFYYEIPVIVHPSWLRKFKHEEYGFSKEFVESCFIKMDPYTIMDLVEHPENYKEAAKYAKEMLKDFLEDKVMQRLENLFQ